MCKQNRIPGHVGNVDLYTFYTLKPGLNVATMYKTNWSTFLCSLYSETIGIDTLTETENDRD